MTQKTNPPKRADFRRRRNEFRAWLIYELNQRGADLPPRPSYDSLRDAVESILLARASR